MDPRSQLDRISIRWEDFQQAAQMTRDIVQELGSDKAALRQLVLNVGHDESLLALCQRHRELFYLVVYDAIDRGFRIRVHMPRVGLFDLPHDHRFSFSTFLMKGCYKHTLYQAVPAGQIDPREVEHWTLEQRPGTFVGKELDDFPIGELVPLWTQEQKSGSSYSLHHTAIHTTILPTERTFTLFLRGPAEKDRSLVMDRMERAYWWKFGRDDESGDLLRDTSMNHEQYKEFLGEMEAVGLI